MGLTITATSVSSSSASGWTFARLYKEAIALMIYNTVTPDATQTVECKRLANEAAREFYSIHNWNFLRPRASLVLWTTVAAGTCTVSSTTITAGSAKFYPTMIGRTITAASGNSYTITGYTSSTVITVNSDASADTGTAFTVTANGDYGLPSDFAYFVDRPTYTGQMTPRVLSQSSPESIRIARTQQSTPMGDPTMFAVEMRAFSSTTGNRWDLLVWPTPNTTRTMSVRYQIDPAEMTDDGEYFYGGPMIGPAMFQCCKMIAERFKGIVNGDMARIFYEQLLPAAIERDKDTRPRVLGPMAGGEDDRPEHPFRMSEWTY